MDSRPEQHILGRTRDLYNVENAPGFDEPSALKTKPNNLLALLMVTLMCSLHDKSKEIVMPKSLTHLTPFNART